MSRNPKLLEPTLAGLFDAVDVAAAQPLDPLRLRQIGSLHSAEHGIAWVEGLTRVQSEEVVSFPGDRLGMAFNLDRNLLGVVLLDAAEELQAGDEVNRTGRVMDTPVGEALLGRVVDAVGRPLDGDGPLRTQQRRSIEREAAAIIDRDPVVVPLQTGLKAIDALIPIGRGQRELILGDRQTGKTAIALDTIINQRDKDVCCIYCAIGQRNSAVAQVVADLRRHHALEYTTVVVASGEDPPGLQFVAPYAAMSMAEYFMEQGQDALIVLDDLTHHARAYRELSLLLRRPPGREAYPGDIFYVHARLLERATRLNRQEGGGSVTALPIIETQEQNLSAYIPTNLVSITDGQIYLSPDLFQKGVLPAVDVGTSVSRVGGKAQLPAYRAVAGDLRLSYAQFEELESFARFGTRLDEETQRTLQRGRRIREILKQDQYQPIPAPEQIAVLLAAAEGIFDKVAVEQIRPVEESIRRAVSHQADAVARRILAGEKLDESDRETLLQIVREAIDTGSDGAETDED